MVTIGRRRAAVDDVIERPIYSVNSGPAMAPVAGRRLRGRGERRRRDRLRRGRHDLRRQRRARRLHHLHARDVARRGVHRPFHRSAVGRRPRSALAAARSPGSTPADCCASGPQSAGAVPGPGLLRPRRHAADGDRCGPGARLHRSRLLPRGRMQLDERGRAAIERDRQSRSACRVERAARAILASPTSTWSPRSATSPSTRASTRAKRCSSPAAAPAA